MASTILAHWCGLPNGGMDETVGRSRQAVRQDLTPAATATPETDPDASLLAGIRLRDVDALDLLMQRYTAPLWRFAYGYVHDRAASNEVVQDTFVALWELGDRWQVTGTVRGYLYAAIRNRALNVRKHAARMYQFAQLTAAEAHTPAMGEPMPAADARLLAEEQRAVLVRAVATLPERWRQAVTLRIEDQLDYEEIADALGVSSGAARKLVERAQRELRRLLTPYLDR